MTSQTSTARSERDSGRTAEGRSVADRCGRLLLSLGNGRPSLGVTLSEAASAAGLHKTTALRLLRSLERRGLVERRFDGRYHVGLRLVELVSGYLDDLDVIEQAHPVLEALCKETGETVHLGTLIGTEVVYLDKIESSQALRMVSQVGARRPLYCTALGKSILAWSGEDLVALVAAAGLEPRTESTITTVSNLRADLAEVRARGYSIDAQENKIGICCVGAEVRDSRGRVVGAISVSGPSVRMDTPTVERLGLAVRVAAGTASRRLGYRPVETRA